VTQRGSGSTGAQIGQQPTTAYHRTSRPLSNLQVSTAQQEAQTSLDSVI